MGDEWNFYPFLQEATDSMKEIDAVKSPYRGI